MVNYNAGVTDRGWRWEFQLRPSARSTARTSSNHRGRCPRAARNPRRTRRLLLRPALYSLSGVKLIKQQTNGRDHMVLKVNASPDDLRAEAMRLQELYGYDIKPGERAGQYLATHPCFHGKFILSLEPE